MDKAIQFQKVLLDIIERTEKAKGEFPRYILESKETQELDAYKQNIQTKTLEPISSVQSIATILDGISDSNLLEMIED